MATFDTGSVNVYSDSGGSGTASDTGAPIDVNTTLDDSMADNLFTFGEQVLANGTYFGTLTVSGDVFVVVQSISTPSTYNLFSASPSADVTYPVGFSIPSVVNDPFVTCFAAGTLIATPDGETTVETLSIGDTLLTQDGREVPVKWIGRQTVHKIFTPAEQFVPVRVSAGALGAGVPHTDLVLTAAHALIIDDFAIDAGALVNGTTITYDPIESLSDRVTYYHIETENHDVILANGVPAETFVDHAGRRAFDNFAEYLDLYGDERPIHEMDLPRISAARLVPPHIRARFAGTKAA